ncbi:hypothetical protein SASPL_148715 [Salvia splendens]|uniref:EGF-like calcium-binding domain-containing protein n=1 Tax=Salvia splendens TaxID=180675 RepID=A0A8X8WB68_SALSN|nr:hypothetical protein SASPL_148715 [Salvia splendens]
MSVKEKLNNMQTSILVMIVFILPTLVLSSHNNYPLSMPSCNDNSCGDIRIPFPFGTTRECYLTIQFWVTCNRTDVDHPKLFWGESEVEITDIYLDGQMRVMQYIAEDCYYRNGSSSSNNNPWIELATYFTVNNTANKFTIVGCDAYALVSGTRLARSFTTGCTAMCSSEADLTEGSCAGVGCCQTPIPQNVSRVEVEVKSYSNYTDVWDFNNCGYAFVVQDTAFNFSKDNLTNLSNVIELPMVVDWVIRNGTCEEAKTNATTYACVSANSECYKPTNGYGYRCRCVDGFEGNPYLSKGCIDIDECAATNHNNCTMKEYCNNEEGTYTCSCPDTHDGDGKGEHGCVLLQKKHNMKIAYVLIGNYTLTL